MSSELPNGVVSKNEVGERSTELRAVLNRFKLATKLAILHAINSVEVLARTKNWNIRKAETEEELKYGLSDTWEFRLIVVSGLITRPPYPGRHI